MLRIHRLLLAAAVLGPAACTDVPDDPEAPEAIAHTDNVADCKPTDAEKKPPLELLTGSGKGALALLARDDGWAYPAGDLIMRPIVHGRADPKKATDLTKTHAGLGVPAVGDLDRDGFDELVGLYEWGGKTFIGHESVDDRTAAAKDENPTQSAWPIKGLTADDPDYAAFVAPTVAGLGLGDVDLDKHLDLIAITSAWGARVAFLAPDNPVAGKPPRKQKMTTISNLPAAAQAPAGTVKSVRFGDVFADGKPRAIAIPAAGRNAPTADAPHNTIYVGEIAFGQQRVVWTAYQLAGLVHVTDAFPRTKNDGKVELVVLATNKAGQAGVQSFALAADGTRSEKTAFHRLPELDATAQRLIDWEGMARLVTLDFRSTKPAPGGTATTSESAAYLAWLGNDNKDGPLRIWDMDAAGKPGNSARVLDPAVRLKGWLVAGNFGGRTEHVIYKDVIWGGAAPKPLALIFPPPSWTPFTGGVNSATATYGTSRGAINSTQSDTTVTRSTAIGRHYATGGKIAGQEVQLSADFSTAASTITGNVMASSATKTESLVTSSRDAPNVVYMESCAIHFVYEHVRGKPLGYRSGIVRDGKEAVVISRPLRNEGGKAETWLRIADLGKWNGKMKDLGLTGLMIRDGGRVPAAADVALFKHVIPHVPGLPWTYYRSAFRPNDDKPAQIAGRDLRGEPVGAGDYVHIGAGMVETKDSGDPSSLSLEQSHDRSTGKVEGDGWDESQAFGVRATFTAGMPVLAEANTSVGVDVTNSSNTTTTTSRMTGKIAGSSWSMEVPGLGGEQQFYNNKKPYDEVRTITRQSDKTMWERFHFVAKPYVYNHKLDEMTAIMVLDYVLKFPSDPWFHPYRTDSDLVGGATKEETLKVGDRYCDRLFGQYVVEVVAGKGGIAVADCARDVLDGVCWDPMAGDPARPQGKAKCVAKRDAKKEAALAKLDACPLGCPFATCAGARAVRSATGAITACGPSELCALVDGSAACVPEETPCVYDGAVIPETGVCAAEPGDVLAACEPDRPRPLRLWCDAGVVRSDPCAAGCRDDGAGVYCAGERPGDPPDLCPRASRCTGGDVEVCDDGSWHLGARCTGATCVEDGATAACVGT